MLNANTCALIRPENAFLEAIIVPQSQYMETSFNRAFGPTGRMTPLVDKTWSGGYSYHQLKVCTTEVDFEFSRSQVPHFRLRGSNISAVWTPSVQETLINGVLQGRKQTDPRGASTVSRRRMLELTQFVWDKLLRDTSLSYSRNMTEAFDQRKLVKNDVTNIALKEWISNVNDGFDKMVLTPSNSAISGLENP